MIRSIVSRLTGLGMLAGLLTTGACSSPKAPGPAGAPAPAGSVGASIDFSSKGADLVFSRVFQDSPTARAGIKPGDRILRINGIPTGPMTMDGAKSLFRGPVGTSMTVTVATGNETPREATLSREVIKSKVPLPGPGMAAAAPGAALAPASAVLAPGTLKPAAAPVPAVAAGTPAPAPAAAPAGAAPIH